MMATSRRARACLSLISEITAGVVKRLSDFDSKVDIVGSLFSRGAASRIIVWTGLRGSILTYVTSTVLK